MSDLQQQSPKGKDERETSLQTQTWSSNLPIIQEEAAAGAAPPRRGGHGDVKAHAAFSAGESNPFASHGGTQMQAQPNNPSNIEIDNMRRVKNTREQYHSARPRRHALLSTKGDWRNKLNLNDLGKSIENIRDRHNCQSALLRSQRKKLLLKRGLRPQSCVGQSSLHLARDSSANSTADAFDVKFRQPAGGDTKDSRFQGGSASAVSSNGVAAMVRDEDPAAGSANATPMDPYHRHQQQHVIGMGGSEGDVKLAVQNHDMGVPDYSSYGSEMGSAVAFRGSGTCTAQSSDGFYSARSETQMSGNLTDPDEESDTEGLRSDPEDLIKSQTPNLSKRYECLEYLGHGSYGHVYGAYDKVEEEKVAIKRITGVFDDVMHAKRLLRELRILRELRHGHIIQLKDILAPSDINNFNELYIVFEFADTDLQKLINSNQHFSNLHIQYFLHQILTALKYVHSANIIHRDLKPANILINANCTLLLCDFGLARGTNRQTGRRVIQSRRTAPPRRMHRLGPRDRKHGATKSASSTTASSSSSSSSSANRSRKRKVNPVTIPGPGPTVASQLTKHVVTRWYRAPELILLESNYNCSIDLWSVGCVLSELLSMQKESFDKPQDRKALFPGKSCFPLSADHPLAYKDKDDQLSVIFDTIGTPSEEDINDVTSKKARTYLRQLPKRPPQDFKEKYPGADPLVLDLLRKLLHFNPRKRLTAEEALDHEYLKDVRDATAEQKSNTDPIFFEFEDAPITKSMIKELIIKEVLVYNKELREQLIKEEAEAAHAFQQPKRTKR